MNARIPRTLPYHGHTINYTGPGRSPGSLTYLDQTSREVHELYFAQIERVGPLYSLGRAANNPTIGSIRIDHATLNGAGPAHLGTLLLIGGLQFYPEGPRATTVWRVPAPTVTHSPPVLPVGGRTFGIVTSVHPHGRHGTIVQERTGRPIFAHHTQLRRGAVLMPGCRVSYVEGLNHRGPIACDVWPV
jgi:hypothetical protein